MTALQDLEDRLAAHALGMAQDVREDVAAAHRRVRSYTRLELEQMCCVLAAMAPVDVPLRDIAWWRALDRAP